MFKKNLLKSVSLIGLSFLASVCANAKEIDDSSERDVIDGQVIPIADMPNEVLDHILSFLPLRDIASAEGVCTNWNEVLVNRHGAKPALSASLFEDAIAHKSQTISDALVAECLTHRMAQKGFAPLENVYISPNEYPQGTRLLNHTDLESHPDIVSSWYSALFREAPQGDHALTLVMAALPQILVQDQLDMQPLASITSYVEKVGKNNHFTRFTGGENEQDFKVLKNDSHTFVVRSKDLETHKDALAALLDTRDDHRVILSLDSEGFLQDGVLTMSNDHIPGNLHHLILADPFGKVTTIGDYFLCGSRRLASFDARAFSSLTVIGHNFLSQCLDLTSFGARGLENVTTIGDYFLCGSRRLTSFDARAFSSLIVIGHNFLSQCLGLTSFGTRGLENVTTIGYYFLCGSQRLASFDPTPLARATQVGPHFLLNTGLCAEDQEKVDA
ncbi:MAG: F-box-like domain-containing protein, partial [Proteobacteria bacterium]|nr:F-box-like domain-containing protein [Pseudomonadota bacterium]